MAGELAAVGAFGFELGFGSFGSGSFGVGEGALCFELGGVAVAEGVAFAGGVFAGAAGLVAGVGFGLAGAGGLGVGGGAGVACGGEGGVALAVGAGGVVACGGVLLAGGFGGGGGFRGGVLAELVEVGGEGPGGVGGVLTYLAAYLDECGRHDGKPLSGPALERFFPWNASPEDLRTWAQPPPAPPTPDQ